MDIFVVQHGETEATLTNEFEGFRDTPLTDRGRTQAKEVARRLNHNEFDLLFSSPLKRALDTSKIIAQEVGTDIRIEEDLKEICYGSWEGKERSSISSTHSWNDNKYNFSYPGSFRGTPGQSYADIYQRVVDFFEKLRQKDLKSVLVVTHLGVIRNIKKYFDECSNVEAVAFKPSPLQVYRIHHSEQKSKTEILDYS